MIRATKRLLVLAAVGLCMGFGVSGVVAQAADPCAHSGRGDRDHDGLSNCMEKRVLGTSPRDYDTDDDGLSDPDELENGTDPTDADCDDDGVDDGEEGKHGSDPNVADTDHDGMPDGEDCDPHDDLESAIKGNATAIVCPIEGMPETPGSLTVLGIFVTLTTETEFDDVESCAVLKEKLDLNGGAHVKVKLSVDKLPDLVAQEVELEDTDHDGCPNGVDDDDDNDGQPDDGDGDGGTGDDGGGDDGAGGGDNPDGDGGTGMGGEGDGGGVV